MADARPRRARRAVVGVRSPVALVSEARLPKLSGCITRSSGFRVAVAKRGRNAESTWLRVVAIRSRAMLRVDSFPFPKPPSTSRVAVLGPLSRSQVAGIRPYRAPATSPCRGTVGPGAAFGWDELCRSIHRPRAATQRTCVPNHSMAPRSHMHLMTGAKSGWYSAPPEAASIAPVCRRPGPDARCSVGVHTLLEVTGVVRR